MPVSGTPLGDQVLADGAKAIDAIEFVRTIAVARIVCPRAMVRLSAGRDAMSRELQALCFLAGANSIFVGSRLLTTGNPEAFLRALHLQVALAPEPIDVRADLLLAIVDALRTTNATYLAAPSR